MNSATSIEAIVIGGGISGLTAAQALREQGRTFRLLERCPSLGGLTRTIEAGDFCFDYTGHFLHLAHHATPADLPYAALDNDDWCTVERRSCCLVGGKLVTAPVQYNLADVPEPLRSEFIDSYEQRPSLAPGETSFRDYMIAGFGERLSDSFLIPQNEKTMATSLDRLSSSAVRRFFPVPDEEKIRSGMHATGATGSLGYNAQFWYPKSGGIAALVKALSQNIHDRTLHAEVCRIDLPTHTLCTSTGNKLRWEALFSSMPLNDLCAMTGDRELVLWGSQLTHSSTVSINLGMRTPLRPDFADLHWIYVPDRDIPFYRVGFYSNISAATCTAGQSSLYVEVGLRPDQLECLDITNQLIPNVVDSLETLGWIDRRDVICTAAHVIRCAYVHHTPARDRLVAAITSRLGEFRVHPIGRYGRWDYTSMEDSIESAQSAVQEAAAWSIR